MSCNCTVGATAQVVVLLYGAGLVSCRIWGVVERVEQPARARCFTRSTAAGHSIEDKEM